MTYCSILAATASLPLTLVQFPVIRPCLREKYSACYVDSMSDSPLPFGAQEPPDPLDRQATRSEAEESCGEDDTLGNLLGSVPPHVVPLAKEEGSTGSEARDDLSIDSARNSTLSATSASQPIGVPITKPVPLRPSPLQQKMNASTTVSQPDSASVSPTTAQSPAIAALSAGSPVGLHPDLLQALAAVGASPSPLLKAMTAGRTTRDRASSVDTLSSLAASESGSERSGAAKVNPITPQVRTNDRSDPRRATLQRAQQEFAELVSFLGVIEIDVDSARFAQIASQHEIPLLDEDCVLPTRIAYQLDAKALNFEELFNSPDKSQPSQTFTQRVMQQLPEGMDIFAFPGGCRLSATKKPPAVHAFVLTDADGERSYGYVATTYVAMPSAVVATARGQIGACLLQMSVRDPDLDPSAFVLPTSLYGPQALVILSKKPYHMFFSAMLEVLTERFVEHAEVYGSILTSCSTVDSSSSSALTTTPNLQPLSGSSPESCGVLAPSTPRRSATGGNAPSTPVAGPKLDALSALHLAQFAAVKRTAGKNAPPAKPSKSSEAPTPKLDLEASSSSADSSISAEGTPTIPSEPDSADGSVPEISKATAKADLEHRPPPLQPDDSSLEYLAADLDDEAYALARLVQPPSAELVYPPTFTSHLTGLRGAMHPEYPHYVMCIFATLCYANAQKALNPSGGSPVPAILRSESISSLRSSTESGGESETELDLDNSVVNESGTCDTIEEAERALPAPTKLPFEVSDFAFHPREFSAFPEPILRVFARRLYLLQRPRKPPLAPWHDVDFAYLCKLLTPECTTIIFDAILQETPVLLLCSAPEALLHICEAILALLTPLTFSFAYIPLLPLCLADFLEAPQPFLVGSLPAMRESAPPYALVVDIDHSRITYPSVLFNPTVNEVCQASQNPRSSIDVGISDGFGALSTAQDLTATAKAAAAAAAAASAASDGRGDSMVSNSGSTSGHRSSTTISRESATGTGLGCEANYVEQPENTPFQLVVPPIYHVRLRHAMDQAESARQQHALKIAAQITSMTQQVTQRHGSGESNALLERPGVDDDAIYGDLSMLDDSNETPISNTSRTPQLQPRVEAKQPPEDIPSIRSPSEFASAQELFRASSQAADMPPATSQPASTPESKSKFLGTLRRRGAALTAPQPSPASSTRRRIGRQTLMTFNSLRMSLSGTFGLSNKTRSSGLSGELSRQFADNPFGDLYDNDSKHEALELNKAFATLRMAFLDTFVSLFRGYRSFLRPPKTLSSPDTNNSTIASGDEEMDVEKWFNRDMFITQSASELHPFLRFFTKSQMFMRFLTDRVTLAKVDWFDQRMLHVLEESSRTLQEDAAATLTCPAYMFVKGLIFDKWELCTLEVEHMSLLWTRREKDRNGTVENVISGKVFLKEHLTTLTLVDEVSAKRTNKPTDFPLCITVYPSENAVSSAKGAPKPEVNVFYFKDSYTRRRIIQLITARTAQHHRQLYATFLADERLRTRALREAAQVQARKNRRAYAGYRHSIHRASVAGGVGILTPGTGIHRRSVLGSTSASVSPATLQSRPRGRSFLESAGVSADTTTTSPHGHLAPLGEVAEGYQTPAKHQSTKPNMLSPFATHISDEELVRMRRLESFSYASGPATEVEPAIPATPATPATPARKPSAIPWMVIQSESSGESSQAAVQTAVEAYLAGLDDDVPKPPPSPFG